MKRFILTIPIQPEGSLHKVHYKAEMGNALLSSQRTTRFPILIPMENAVPAGEHIKVTVILNEKEHVPENYTLFKEELEELASQIPFTYEISEIHMPDTENAETYLQLFKELAMLLSANKDEELYACITYGTKAMPMLFLMALTFAYKLCDSFTIEAIVYGRTDHDSRISSVYDVSSLFYLNSAVNNMANLKLTDPVRLIETIIG